MKRTTAFICLALAALSATAAPMRTRQFKRPPKMEMLRPGEVKPQGWLRDSKIPVVLLGGEVPPTGFPCDSVGVNYLAHGRRARVNLSSPTARHDFNLLSHGELFGDVAIRLMLQRLSYGPKHPPAEVYLDLPKPKPLKKGTER